MRFNEDVSFSFYSIRGYEPGQIHVIFPRHETPPAADHSGGPYQETLTRSFILTPEILIKDWNPDSVEVLQLSHFESITKLDPEVVLLGTGQCLTFPEVAITMPLVERGIGLEVMDSPAACRTYNILMHEGRRVAVAFIQ